MKSKFAGIVTEITDENNLVFRSDNKFDSQLQQIVGIKVDDSLYVLASVAKIDVNYFINDAKEYFTTLASLNKLSDLSSSVRSPKYSHQITASYIGIYQYEPELGKFVESDISVNIFTPKIFDEVVAFNFECIDTVYGLTGHSSKSLHIGKLLYPKYSNIDLPDANVSIDTFNNHTLISGVTGSGKSRLAALIMKQTALNGGHVTVIDPHNEYIKLTTSQKGVNIYMFSHNLHLLEKHSNVTYRDIVLTNKYLLPQVIIRLLPGFTNSQQTYIYDVYKNITNEKDYIPDELTIKKYIDRIVIDFNNEYINYGYSVDKLSEAQKYAKEGYKDYKSFIKRYTSYIDREMRGGSPQKVHVIFAVLKKMIEIYDDEIFQENNPKLQIPAWLDIENRNTINIFNLDYDENDEIRRHLNAIMSCFFIPQINKEKKFRLLVIEEAHLLLKENDTTGTKDLLSRLLRESRKYGVSIIFLTQNEKDVPENIKSQFQNRFRFREENNEKIKFINNQTCMCSLYRGKLSFPMRVDNVEEKRL